MNDTIRYLEDVKDRLEFVPYETIYNSIANMRDKFIPTAILHKGWYIDRVRVHKNQDELFTNELQVSYIHDKEVIDKYVKFGRANNEKQSVFYGAVETEEIRQQRVVAYFETSELLKELNLHENATELFTVSRWKIIEDIEILEMIFSDEALEKSSSTRASFDHQLANYNGLPMKVEYEEQGKFFSNEFARKDVRKGQDYKYKITSAYANYVWNNTDFKGITYPSVQSDYKGQNVALLPEVVDKSLKLVSVGLFKFERRNGVNLPVDSIKIATELGEDNMDFQWIDYIGGEQS